MKMKALIELGGRVERCKIQVCLTSEYMSGDYITTLNNSGFGSIIRFKNSKCGPVNLNFIESDKVKVIIELKSYRSVCEPICNVDCEYVMNFNIFQWIGYGFLKLVRKCKWRIK